MEYGEVERGGAGREEKHSRMGIASFVIAVLAIIAIVLFFVVSPFLVSSTFGNIDPQNFDPQSVDQSSPEFVVLAVLVFGFIASVLLTFVGFGLGIAGLIQRRRKRLFATLGTIFNGLVVLVVVALFVLGLALGGV